MICIEPILLKPNKEKGETEGKIVPCGKCDNCLRKRQMQWMVRLEKEAEYSTSAFFITLTYSDDNLPYTKTGLPTLNKRHLQLFMKKLRSYAKRKYDITGLKFYAVGEYGATTARPHYHLILFNYPASNQIGVEIHDLWARGHVDVGSVTGASINYVTGYVMKRPLFENKLDYEERQVEFSNMSKNLGAQFLTEKTIDYYRKNPKPYMYKRSGKRVTMPRYYRDRIYDDEMKAQINEQTEEYINSLESTRAERGDYKDLVKGKAARKLAIKKRDKV